MRPEDIIPSQSEKKNIPEDTIDPTVGQRLGVFFFFFALVAALRKLTARGLLQRVVAYEVDAHFIAARPPEFRGRSRVRAACGVGALDDEAVALAYLEACRCGPWHEGTCWVFRVSLYVNYQVSHSCPPTEQSVRAQHTTKQPTTKPHETPPGTSREVATHK